MITKKKKKNPFKPSKGSGKDPHAAKGKKKPMKGGSYAKTQARMKTKRTK